MRNQASSRRLGISESTLTFLKGEDEVVTHPVSKELPIALSKKEVETAGGKLDTNGSMGSFERTILPKMVSY